jgi:hypothetical protein
VSTLCCAVLSPAGAPLAASFAEFVDPNPAPGNQFGAQVVPLSTGNVVITSPRDDAGEIDAGAVYLFNGATGALISTLRGSGVNHHVGGGRVYALTNGNFVVTSPQWDNGVFVEMGAVTWGSGITGVSGVVSAANSLVGSRSQDYVGGDQFGNGVTVLSNGNYVVASPFWNRGPTAALQAVGAVTWGNGTTGTSGVVSIANSLVGSTAWDQIGLLDSGFNGVKALSNGNYVVPSPLWDNGALVEAGAATWGSGTAGVSGAISASNSLVGTTANDYVGTGLTPLSNGNYVVRSPSWSNGAVPHVGAATWASGTTGVTGAITAANSLIGSTSGDAVGSSGAPALSNGNYVVVSPSWNNGAVADVGAATWCDGTTGVSGVVSAANSLVGSTAGDQVGYMTAFPPSAGGGVTALSNGNYVVASRLWDNGAAVNAGAATWANGSTGLVGTVSAANSLVGSSGDSIAFTVTALSNGNYVVASPAWVNGAVDNAGAATWGDGTTGTTGVVSVANSLVGYSVGDSIGSGGVTALANGNYVVRSWNWDNGTATNAGAATWGSGTTAVSATVSSANSLVGSTAGDNVGRAASLVTALANGNYVVRIPLWDNGAAVNVGAATWGSGTSGVTGVISSANSLIGTTANDQVGFGVTALSNGNFVLASFFWDNGALVNAGAATWSTGATGNGVVSTANSLVGTSANTNLFVVEDVVNHVFIASFPGDGSGRVRVGPDSHPAIVSAADIPADQGAWVRVTFVRSGLDDATSSPPVSTYGVWRHVPGTLSAITGARANAEDLERLRAVLPPGLKVRESEGRFYVVGVGSQAAGSAEAFPPGTWELVTSVPALQQGQYVVAVPTISNAAPNDFVVTAHTTTPSIWFVSGVVSGQSIDNLAPATPTQLTASYASGQTNLQWAANTENDLGSYRVYRGAAANFTPALDNRIATVVTNSHADVGPAGSYYKVSAVDVNGNESGYALITPDGTVGVGEGGPVAFALHGVHPNPTRGNALHVVFALPSGSSARLELLDVSGRQVRSRDVGSLGTGRHTVNLSEGRSVAPGIYWLRLTQGTNQRTMRVAVIE